MARNIEIKARIRDMAQLQAAIEQMNLPVVDVLTQHDIFYSCTRGRLKLRIFSAQAGELIFYRRANTAGPKESFYQMSKTSEPHELAEVLALAYPMVGEVKKRRTLYLIGRTRVHLDQVEGLGQFIELEVVMSEGENQQRGLQIAEQLMRDLHISQDDLIDVAYADLLLAQQEELKQGQFKQEAAYVD